MKLKKSNYGNAKQLHITPPHQLLKTLMFFSVLLLSINSIAQTLDPPVKLWTTEIDNPTVGRDWSLAVLEDRDNNPNIVSVGFTSVLCSSGCNIPSVSKTDGNGNVLWNSWNATTKICSSNDNYGAAVAVIEKKVPNGFSYNFTNYIIITREKPCGGTGTDRTVNLFA